jgi:hypothetical protein
MARNDLRTSLSTANRHVFDSAIQRLADDGVIEVVMVRRGTRYRLTDSCQGGSPCQGVLSQVIPEGGGPVKTNLCVVLVRSASFLVLAGRVEAGVGVKTRAEPDRVAAVGP